MTLTIELTPEKEKVLRREAARRGMPIADYAKAILEDRLPDGKAATSADPEDRARAFQEWAESHNINNPLLAEEALRRDNIHKEPG